MSKLTTAEWRLFLLSDCLKYYPEISDRTKLLRLHKEDVLGIGLTESTELNNFISELDSIRIRTSLKKEWKFSGKVVDNGYNNHTTCEYCQHQQIRYRYLCVNEVNRTWLSLGSVCVGKIIHGEDAMRDNNFSTGFVKELEGLRKNATKDDPSSKPIEDQVQSSIDHASRRAEQFDIVQKCVAYIRRYGGSYDLNFVDGIKVIWSNNKSLSDKQIDALKNICLRIKEKKSIPLSLSFKSIEAGLHYQKVLLKLHDHPDNEFYKGCKLRIERYGELTPNMIKALMGSKKEAIDI